MKVLIVSFLLDRRRGGGAAAAANGLVRELARQGHEVVAVTTHNETQPRITHEDGLKVYAFRPRNLYWVAEKDRQPLAKKAVWQVVDTWNPHVYRYVRDVLRLEKPDVVHVHKLRGLSPSVWAAARAENCRPIIQTCHDYELISPEGTLNSTVGRWALEQHWALRPYQRLRSHWSNQVDAVTAPSDHTLNTITNLGFFGRSRRFVVPNAHELNVAQLRAATNGATGDLRSPTGEFHLLYMGRLELNKGIDVLCRAFAQAVTELPYLRLHVAGSGTRGDELRADYADVPQIHFHGHVAGPEKERLLSLADVLVMPSVWQEVFGISIVEAYAHGKPIIASHIGGMPELVREGQTGLLVGPGDVAELRDAIRRLANEPGLARAMAPACYEAAENYTWQAVAKAYLEVYKSAGNEPTIVVERVS